MPKILVTVALLAGCAGGPVLPYPSDAGPAPELFCEGSPIADCPPGWAAGCALSADAHIRITEQGSCAARGFIALEIPCNPTTDAPDPTPCEVFPGQRLEARCVPIYDGCPSPR